MCGITGWVNFRKNISQDTKVVEKMAATLKRRGPDDSGTWSSSHCLLGHTRLAVVDVTGGKQPMTRKYHSRLYTICYNGELYNTEEIRTELKRQGYTFQSYSDTEVLLAAYSQWKENCLRHLNGIFAFAIWDDELQQLFAARDRLGVKPFFFSQGSEGFLFGSEQKAILAHPGVKAEVNTEGLQEIFGLGPSRTPGHGVFRGIDSLRPAHAFIYSKNGLKTWRYWNVKSKTHEDSLEETASKVGNIFTDAVTRQLVSDVPISTFLSGGLDSSAITAIAAKHVEKEKNEKLHTFSVDYAENENYFVKSDFQPDMDQNWIDKMVKYAGTQHHNEIISTEQLVERLSEAVKARDLPGMADVDSSLLWFCQRIKERTTVSLSGECADEIFGGYPWFHKPELLHHEGFPWMPFHSERETLLSDYWKNKLSLSAYVKERYQETTNETPYLDGESKIEARRRELFYMNLQWFMTTLLDRKDRMSMAASLEVRVPFADHRLVEYVWNVPWHMKQTEGREKGILRNSLKNCLPENILYRKKSPYPKTHHPRYTKQVKEWLLQILENPSSPILYFIDKQTVKDIAHSGGAAYTTPWFGQLMTGPQLLAYLIQVDVWMREYNINIIES
ncbi:asparagine synthase (glutamine-hydrolyzing) [Alteribacillus iranensis]|uniref:asparagine synthase (glutamine-hydrolyzing) n=1 Tax=Alteribacillus iranensis TaxID=930128 RepID=A0A1I2AC35_9BACI|nr:asparagine synthase (glutamine-hydrolyzing) [Alteribacillus iranensis]SFE41584.1 asparagine synthase (glutamine-hydrolysing) [Alteribacillus iranensis]